MKQTRRSMLVLFMVGIVVLGYCLMHVPAHAAQQQAKQGEDAVYRIGFHLWKPGKIYDEAMAGIKDGLTLEGISYKAVVLQSNREKARAIENLRQLDAMGLHLIYSLSSAGTKIAKKLGLQTPVIATVVNHPASLGVAQENGSQHIKLTGTSYYVDARKQLQLYLELFPNIAKVGMIYDKKNPAGFLAEEPFMHKSCQDLGKQFLSVGVTQTSELVHATQNLIQSGVDAIVIPTNRLVYKNLAVVLAITHKHKIPVLSMNKQGVENGALAALFADTYKLGRYTAPMAKRILVEKIDPTGIPFQFSPEPDIILNLREAKALGYEFPAHVLGEAVIILQ